MTRSGKRGRVEGCLVVEDIMRKALKIRTRPRRNNQYFFANVAFFDLIA
jgi:hypothetical protein